MLAEGSDSDANLLTLSYVGSTSTVRTDGFTVGSRKLRCLVSMA
jgi:hypothetical protein